MSKDIEILNHKELDIKNALSDDEDDIDDSYKQKKGTTSTSKTPILDSYSRDLTRQAEEGKLDPIVGRLKEIERVSQILSRRKKNNPILIGEPGCVDENTLISVKLVSNESSHKLLTLD